MSLERLLAIASLTLLLPWGESHAQAGGSPAGKARTASFRTGEPGPFDPPELSPAAPWRPGGAPAAARGPRADLRDGALDSAAVVVGEFQWTATDLVVRGRGPDFVLARKYRSKSKERGVLGPGWTHAYELRVERVGPDLLLHDGWGRRDLFERNPDDTYTASGWLAVMTEDPDGDVCLRLGPFGNVWCFADPDELVLSAGKLTRIADQFGNALAFAYDTNGDLDEVVDTLGRTIDFVHDSQRRLESVTDFAGRMVQYAYYAPGEGGGKPGDLKSVTSPPVVGTPTGNDFPDGKTTTYSYTSGFADERSNHNLRTITNPDGTLLLRNRYGRGPTVDGPRDWLVSQWLAPAAHELQLHYFLYGAGLGCIVNDEAGNVREYAFDLKRSKVKLRTNTGRANPDQPTTPSANRPQAPLRAGEAPFLTTWTVNPDGLVLLRRDEGGGDARVRFFRYENSGMDRTRQGNLVQIVHGSPEPGGALRSETFTYEPVLGVLSAHTRPGGQVTRYLRDPNNGVLTSIVHPIAGVQEDFEHNAFGQLTAHVHADNGSGQRQRDELVYYDLGSARGYLRWFRENADHAPAETLYRYDIVGNLTALIDPAGHITQFAVNALDQVVRLQEPELQLGGNPVLVLTDYFYDASDNLVRILRDNVDEGGAPGDPARWDLTLRHDARGRLTSVAREVVPGQYEVTDYAYLPARTEIRLPRVAEGLATHVVTEEVDERGLLFRRTRGTGHPTDQSTMQWDYDAFGGLVRHHGPLERSDPDDLCVLADDFGWPLRVTDAMGNVRHYEYDENGNRTRVVFEGELVDVAGDADNVRLREARMTYDNMNRLTSYTEDWFDAATQEPVHTGQYNFVREIAGTGALTRLTDAAGEVWTWSRDLATRQTTRTDPAGQTLRDTFDERGNVRERLETTFNQLTGQFEPYPTLFTYDEWNRRVDVRDAQQNSLQTLFDSHSRPVVELGPSGWRIERVFDGRGLLLEEREDLNGNGQTTDTADRATAYTYDLAGNPSTRTDDNGNTTYFRFDSLDRHIQTIYPDLTSWVRTYDPSDDPIQLVDGNGSVIGQQFDLLGRLTVRTIQPGTGVSPDVLREDYAYDGLSRLVQASDEDTNVVLAHSSLGHVLRDSQSGFAALSDYDARGYLTSCTYPGGRQVTFVNDALGHVTSVREGAAGPVLSTLLHADDRVVRRTLVNGVRTDFEFNGIGNAAGDLGVRQLERARHELVAGATLSEQEWAYQGDQSPTRRNDGRLGFEHELLYDPAARLVQWDRTILKTTETVQYALDGVGNRTLVTGGPDAGSYFMDPATPIPADYQQNQYSATPFDARRYDETGNPTVWGDLASSRDLVYDYRGRLVEWTDATGRVHRYTYDPLDRMTSHIRNATATPTRVVMRYRQHQRIEELDTGLGALTTYTFEGEAEHPFERRDGAAELYYLRDREDTVRALVDEAAGIVEYYDYDPFGNATVRDGAGALLPGSAYSRTPLFRGMRWHEEIGLYRHARGFHDPRTGRDFDGAPSTADDREPGLPGVTIYADIIHGAGVVDAADLNLLGLNWQQHSSVPEYPDFAWVPYANEATQLEVHLTGAWIRNDAIGSELSTVSNAETLTIGVDQTESAEPSAGGLRLDGLFGPGTLFTPGPTQAAGHEDEIDVIAWSWGVTQSGTFYQHRFATAQITSFSVGASTSPAAVPGLQATNTGQVSPLHVELTNLIIPAYDYGGSGQSEVIVLGQLWNATGGPPASAAVEHYAKITLERGYGLFQAPSDRRPPYTSFVWGSFQVD